MTATADLTTALQPALDAYSAALAEHGHTYDGRPRCRCGWDRNGTATNRSVGMHVAAAEKRASKAYDAAAAEVVHQQVYGRTA